MSKRKRAESRKVIERHISRVSIYIETWNKYLGINWKMGI